MSEFERSRSRPRLQRSRRDVWFTGVCGGIAAYLRISAGWIRLAFVVAGLGGGLGVLLYAFAWVVMPLEPEAQGVDTTKAPDVRGLTIAVFIAGAVVSALLLVADGSTTRIGAGVVLAPMAIAVGGAVIRRGSLRSKGTLLVTGIALTAVLGWLNYHPGFGDRTIRPEIHELSPGFSNLFGTLTIDLSAYEVSSGNLTVNAKTLGGDIVLRVPENASVQVDESIVFGATERNDASGPPRSLAIRLDVKGVVGSVRVLRGR